MYLTKIHTLSSNHVNIPNQIFYNITFSAPLFWPNFTFSLLRELHCWPLEVSPLLETQNPASKSCLSGTWSFLLSLFSAVQKHVVSWSYSSINISSNSRLLTDPMDSPNLSLNPEFMKSEACSPSNDHCVLGSAAIF